MINSILLSVILQQQNSYREYLAGDGIDPYSYVEFDSHAVSEVKDLSLPEAKKYIKVIFQSEDTNRRLIQLCLLGKFTTRAGTSAEQEIIESFHAKYLKGGYPGDIYKSIPTDDLLTLYY